MSTVIIGGGIAGLSLGIFLEQAGFSTIVCERNLESAVKGHAFLMHREGVEQLQQMAGNTSAILKANHINKFVLKKPDDSLVKSIALHDWYCIKRADLLAYLTEIYPSDKLHRGLTFSHFSRNNKGMEAAHFENGQSIAGEVFVGADGGNSIVRNQIFGPVDFTPVEVKEIVGIIKSQELAAAFAATFTKYQDRDRGLAFGFIPTSPDEFVWFMQYDARMSTNEQDGPEALRTFCMTTMSAFPDAVHQILQANDFSTSYIWDTRDFDPLPSFSKENVVLIGDAAHLALPFTSAGTTNAILDASVLATCMGRYNNVRTAFRQYYDLRATDVAGHLAHGRELKYFFLNPGTKPDEEIPVPLIVAARANPAAGSLPKKIKVLYFTDPVCSTCWIIQPLLRKLKLEYDDYIDMEYRMGGLLPSWNEYDKGSITSPDDAARLWNEAGTGDGMPMDGDVWLEDPLSSSYPPSVAFKAAQLQDPERALLFLRRMKEMLFLEKKNVIKWEHLKDAALTAGLDADRLRQDFTGHASELFREDLMLAHKLGVTGFPTFFFSNGDENITIRGLQAYDVFEDALNKLLPDVEKSNVRPDHNSLFSMFPTMTDKEFQFLTGLSKDDAATALNLLYEKGILSKRESKNGTIWANKDFVNM